MTRSSNLSSPPSADELGSWRLWRHLLLLRAAEQAASSVVLTDEEIEKAWGDFCRANGSDAASGLPVSNDFQPCSPEMLRAAVTRDLRIARWKKETFGPHARDHFDGRKPGLDRVVYNLIRVRDAGVARELWFRLKENESTFADLAPRYTQGHESHTSGLLGPTAFGAMHPALASHLRSAEEGKLLKPLQVADWYLVARVEKILPATYDDQMQIAMIEELAQQWLGARINESR
jgi:parvulin-like peptidyl-prolyl isomerase